MPAQPRGDFPRLAATGLDVAGTRLHAAPSSAGHGDGVMPPKSLNWTHPNHRRIGVAIAENPVGPWTRFDRPVVDISAHPDAPDALMTSNPAAWVRPDGGLLMVYKAVATKSKAPFGGPVVPSSQQPTSPKARGRKISRRFLQSPANTAPPKTPSSGTTGSATAAS